MAGHFVGMKPHPEARTIPTSCISATAMAHSRKLEKTGAGVKAFVKASGTADYDNDGDVDIILSVYKGKNILLQNRTL